MFFLVCFFAITTCAASIFAIKFAILLLKMEDAVEESLDILDKRYSSISKTLSTPLFYDSPEVKKTLNDIKASRDSILYIANVLTSFQNKELVIEDIEGEEGL